MGRLFRKIFLSFWVTILLMAVGVAWGVSTYMQEYGQQRFEQEANARLDALSVILEHSSPRETRKLLRQFGPRSGVAIQITTNDGEHLMGRPLPPHLRPEDQDKRITRKLTTADGETYHLIAQMKRNHPAHEGKPPSGARKVFDVRDPWVLALRIGIALLVSAAVSMWLAWYLTRPVRILQAATHALANGDLDVRVGQSIKQRDEIADLGMDFDRMAERLQALLISQRQLLSDISHELRSPLARLRVAVQLATSKTGELSELDRIEKEVCRLDELVGEVLSLSRMEASDTYPQEDYVELSALLEHIIADANFEAANRACHIALQKAGEFPIQANAELLHRALENIIRNAVNYTAETSTVSVDIEASEADPTRVSIKVTDQGPGVPEKYLDDLFTPFFRVQTARDRDSGGYGLGLAIAARGLKLHGGTIRATNVIDGGLCIQVTLALQAQEDPQH